VQYEIYFLNSGRSPQREEYSFEYGSYHYLALLLSYLTLAVSGGSISIPTMGIFQVERMKMRWQLLPRPLDFIPPKLKLPNLLMSLPVCLG
jgi:hypothetical protein